MIVDGEQISPGTKPYNMAVALRMSLRKSNTDVKTRHSGAAQCTLLYTHVYATESLRAISGSQRVGRLLGHLEQDANAEDHEPKDKRHQGQVSSRSDFRATVLSIFVCKRMRCVGTSSVSASAR